MATPKRESVMTAFKNLLRTIMPVNGYSFDVSQNVYDWREAPISSTECPAIICRDIVETIFVAVGLHLHNLKVQMELILMEGVTPAQMRQFIADVTYCLGQHLTLDALVSDIRPIEGEDIVIEQHENKIGFARMSVIVEYTTEPWNPYQ